MLQDTIYKPSLMFTLVSAIKYLLQTTNYYYNTFAYIKFNNTILHQNITVDS